MNTKFKNKRLTSYFLIGFILMLISCAEKNEIRIHSIETIRPMDIPTFDNTIFTFENLDTELIQVLKNTGIDSIIFQNKQRKTKFDRNNNLISAISFKSSLKIIISDHESSKIHKIDHVNSEINEIYAQSSMQIYYNRKEKIAVRSYDNSVILGLKRMKIAEIKGITEKYN